MSKYRQEVDAAQVRFAAATAAFQRAESERTSALAAAQAEHRRQVEASQAKAAAFNRDVEGRRTGFAAGEPDAVEWFVNQVLKASRYPKGFPSTWQVAYRPENRDVVVELELPNQQIVPAVREYRCGHVGGSGDRVYDTVPAAEASMPPVVA